MTGRKGDESEGVPRADAISPSAAAAKGAVSPSAAAAKGLRRIDPSRQTPQLLPSLSNAETHQLTRRIGLAWQLWLDGEIEHAPLPLADGLLVVLDRPRGSAALRLDAEGRELWQVELPGVASGDPVRTHGFLAVPIGGERVAVIDVADGKIQRSTVAVSGATLRGSIAALGGRLWVRLARTPDGLGPFLAVLDLMGQDEGLRLFPDPLGDAIETRFRLTNHTLVAAAEHPDGHALLVGLDEVTARVLWRHEIPRTGVVDLWAAGGLVDLVITHGVRSWDARTGTPFTRRFEGKGLEGARLSGEALIVMMPDNGHGRRLQAFDACTEDQTGELPGVQRIIGASSDFAILRGADELPIIAELPSLAPLALRDAEALQGAELAAFSRHALWIVGHGGRSLSCLETPV